MALGYERNEIEGAIGVPDIPRKQKHLYLGPGAIREEYRRRGLFEQLVFCILESYAQSLGNATDLSQIGVIVQATRANRIANRLYGTQKKLGFRFIGSKEYEGRAGHDQDNLYYKDAASLLARLRELTHGGQRQLIFVHAAPTRR